MAQSTKVWPLPVSYSTISSGFGPRTITVDGVTKKQNAHGAIDIPAPVGTPVMTVLPGKVGTVVFDHKEAGHYVEVEHPANGTWTRYLHLSDIKVKVGDELPAGGVVGLSGGAKGARGAGFSSGPHLHFEVWRGRPYRGGTKTDPEPYLLELALQTGKELASKNKGLLVAAAGSALIMYTLMSSRRSPSRANPLILTKV